MPGLTFFYLHGAIRAAVGSMAVGKWLENRNAKLALGSSQQYQTTVFQILPPLHCH